MPESTRMDCQSRFESKSDRWLISDLGIRISDFFSHWDLDIRHLRSQSADDVLNALAAGRDKRRIELIDELPRQCWIVEVRRPDLNGACPRHEKLHHIVDTGDPAHGDHGDFDAAGHLPDDFED